MAGEDKAQLIADAIDRTTRDQGLAADPVTSAWVSANAGTGKTHVLTTRVLRLMLAGTAPERILCLTYTKAAAAEMSKRIFGELGSWVVMSDDDLRAKLARFLTRKPTDEELIRARTLFTAAIETPGGLKVQTIHSFAERLLQRFPLEAGVTPGFTILDEAVALSLRRDAIDTVLGVASRDRRGPLGTALTTSIAYAADARFDDMLADALQYRDWLRVPADAEMRRLYCRHLGVRETATAASIEAEIAAVATNAALIGLRDVLAAGSKTEIALSENLGAAVSATSPGGRVAALRRSLLTKTGAPRKSLMTKGTAAVNGAAFEQLSSIQDRFYALEGEALALKVVDATMALVRLGAAVLERYEEAKVRRAALDFDDLIEKTRLLLTARGAAEWVLYKLDRGIDHILVDESQDTNPNQWDVVAALAEEFFSGEGAREDVRTLFAVGDEKQSIYSFQGAAPKMFGDMGRHFAAMTKSAGAKFLKVSLDVSFRTVEPVLSAVDRVFSDPLRTPGVRAGGRDPLHHVAKRFRQGGIVEIWPTEKPDAAPAADAWSPLDEGTATVPVLRLANRIADTIKGWLDDKELLTSENRPIGAGDIVILVRKRQPFAAPMVAALKARDIPVAGTDRIRLADQLAVQDLISLGDFLTLPEDDLSLAEVLKSPIFDFDDNDLLALAPERKGTLWKALLDAAPSEPRFEAAAATLKRWRKAADFSPPYEFFARLLDGDGVRAKLIARLGPDAADPIDELETLALTYDDRAPPSLSGFLHWLREQTREIKRDMEHGRNEVRVMTVHGAKGLEAPIVFLPDTCSPPTSGGRGGGSPMEIAVESKPGASHRGFVWPVKGAGPVPAIATAREARATAEREEHDRLLYVAMTRARDRLYVAGFEGAKKLTDGCWYELIRQGLEDVLEEAAGANGEKVLRLASSQSGDPEPASLVLTSEAARVALPAWATRPAPRESQLSVPLAPSRLAPYETDDAGDPLPETPKRDPLAEPTAISPAALSGEGRFLRGTLTHALLQHLPGFDRKLWPKAAAAFVETRGSALPARLKASIVSETLRVLDDEAFAPLFGTESRAEVCFTALIPRPSGTGAGGTGPALKIAGQIDRLAVTGGDVLIVDYKTNRHAPASLEDVGDVYLYQLAAYCLAVGELYPGKTVRAALLWTDGPRIMEIPTGLLEKYALRLWDLDSARLDA
jgi:ATP-dependent helicase/nuclease subunit A